MLRETAQENGHQRPHQHETTRLAMVAGLVSLVLTNLLACSGGGSSSSSHDPALASTCNPPTVSGSPLTNTLNAARVTPSNGIQVRLTWNPEIDPAVKGYKLYYGTAPKSYEQAIDVGLSTAYAFSNLRSGTTYYFAVTAYNSMAEGCASNEVTKTIP